VQPTQKPAVNDLHRSFDPRFVAHCRLLTVRERPTAGSASPTLSIRSRGESSNWGVAAVIGSEDRVTYLDDDGRLRSISADLTDIDPPDAFRRVVGGSAAFHPVDLLARCELLERSLRAVRYVSFRHAPSVWARRP
jgi:Family of unknown function (DUF5372)